MVNEALESRRGIYQSKWHHYVLVVTPPRLESRFELVPRLNLHLVIRILQINSRENPPSHEGIHNIIYPGQRKSVELRIGV